MNKQVINMNTAVSLKKRTNLSINESILNEAKALGVNLSSSAEMGIIHALNERKRELWVSENKAALASSNEYVESHGVPLKQFRNF